MQTDADVTKSETDPYARQRFHLQSWRLGILPKMTGRYQY